MKNNILIKIINFTLSIALFTISILFLIQLNIRIGINKKEITKLIDNFNIKEEITKMNSYEKLEYEDQMLLNEIISSKEFSEYIKENVKAMYLNIFYAENVEYIDSNKLKTFVNNIIEEQEEDNISNVINEIVEDIDNSVKEVKELKDDTKLIRDIFSKKTSTILLIGIIVISLIIILINSYDGLIWIGITKIISGSLFLLPILSINGTINITNVDATTYEFIYRYLVTLLKTIKISCSIFITVGIVEIIIYVIHKYKGEENARDRSI